MEIKLDMRDCKKIADNVTKKTQNSKFVSHASFSRPIAVTPN